MSKKEITMATKTETRTTDHAGGVPGVVNLALDVAERGQSTAIAVLQDARLELRTAIESGLELAEKLGQGALRFTRKLVAKVDEVSNEALTGAEHALSNAVRTARETARDRSEGATPARSQAA